MSWDNGDIPDKYREHYSAPYKWSKLLAVEVQDIYDGVLMYKCPGCSAIWSRFGNRLIWEGGKYSNEQWGTIVNKAIQSYLRSKTKG